MKSFLIAFVFPCLFNMSFAQAEQLELFPETENKIMCRGEVYVTSKNMVVDSYADGCYASDILSGEVCFVGDSKWAAWALDQGILWGDEEYVENARANGKNEVVMDFVDGPNEIREETSISSCP
ncbi:MAG: hypothetical protein KF767_06585 [Bdellovibrionaceae bacterium]|nr:hypothetical protein [Pseudobdellovibrionaceae bacterium]